MVEYTKTCLTCQQDKVDRQKTLGLLESLLVPSRPWESVSLDFTVSIPKTRDLTSILVVVDNIFQVYNIYPIIEVVSGK